MYQNKLVASLKANGKILREFKDTVYIPFGSEYSFLIKNLNTTRALVNIYIDGESVIHGGLVLNAGQEVDLERYVKNSNLFEGNKFKFIERTDTIEQHRGVKLEDGLVRIEFQYELPRPITNAYDNFRYTGMTNASYNVNGMMRSVDYSAGEAMKASATSAINSTLQSMNIGATSAHDGMATMDWMPANDVGITVPGSKSTQAFTTTYMNALDPEKHNIVLKLLGETADNQPIVKPITTKHKPKCVTCGKQNKATAKFCTECGTALEMFA
jgi:hypothetical protein